eukprot:Hpha_TRINITY_DN16116_c2_g3::TRINITY_DN16116_c2_g3_i1::g.6735::m.6735/K17907/ATG9; autophagy-related protein 9
MAWWRSLPRRGYSRVEGDDDPGHLVELGPMERDSAAEEGRRAHTMPHSGVGENIFAGEEDADGVLRGLYEYWLNKGTWSLILTRVFLMFRDLFTIFVTTVLAFYVNWNDVLSCSQEDCLTVSPIRNEPFSDLGGLRMFFLLSEIILGLYLVWNVSRSFSDLFKWRKLAVFCEDALGIPEDDIKVSGVEWQEVAARLVHWQVRSGHRIKSGGPVLNELGLLQRMLRIENYLVALSNADVFDGRRLGRVVESILEHVLRRVVFTRGARLSSELNADLLAVEFRRWGVLCLLASPFIATWLAVTSVFRYGTVVKNNFGVMSARRWSPNALWKFREYNEPNHAFEKRMANARHVAQSFVDKFPDPLTGVLLRTVIFVTGGLAVVIFMISLINDSALVFLSLWDRTLFWWLGILTLITMGANAAISPPPGGQELFLLERDFMAVASWTHWWPDSWTWACRPAGIGKQSALAEFSRDYFLSTARYVASEGLAVLKTPYVLYYVFPQECDRLVRFLGNANTHVEGVGDIVKWSTFRLRDYGDDRYGSPFTGTSPSRQGKMEKSLLSFCAVHYRHCSCRRTDVEGVICNHWDWEDVEGWASVVERLEPSNTGRLPSFDTIAPAGSDILSVWKARTGGPPSPGPAGSSAPGDRSGSSASGDEEPRAANPFAAGLEGGGVRSEAVISGSQSGLPAAAPQE